MNYNRDQAHCAALLQSRILLMRRGGICSFGDLQRQVNVGVEHLQKRQSAGRMRRKERC